MPRLIRGASADDGPRSARHRLTASLGAGRRTLQDASMQDGTPLLPLWDPEVIASAIPATDHGGAARGAAGTDSGPRWRTRTRVVVLVVVPVILFMVWCTWQALTGQATVVSPDHQATVTSQGTSGAAMPESGAGGGKEAAGRPKVVVHVAGAVVNPGIVNVQEGSRVFEAIAAAGGAAPTADLNQLNLAGVVRDGEKLHVPQQGEAPSSGGGGQGASGGPPSGQGAASGGKVNINQASAEELGTLPRVGPVLAGRIVAWRMEHGPFSSVEELDAVDGVGPKLLEALLPLVTV